MAKAQHTPAAVPDNRQIVVGLDIGTSKVCAIVAERHQESPEEIHVLGIGHAPSDGLNRGVVVNIEKTVRSIERAVEQAQQQSGVQVRSVSVGIAGDHVQSFPSRGVVTISNPERVVRQQDVDRLIEDSQRVLMPSDRRILHVIPQEYIIDGQDGIFDPVGMSGIRMEANVHIITGLVTAAQNIYRCVERAGLVVEDIVLEPLASANAVLDEEEKEIGVALIDIGGGTTDIAVYEDKTIRHTSVVGIAGRMVTDDIRRGLGVIGEQAERIKREYGYALASMILNDEVFMIPGIGGRKPMEISKLMLAQIIQPRMEEILEFALMELKKSGYLRQLSAGVVLTGGGALLRGSVELAQEVLGMPVKLGIPSGFGGSGLAPEVESPIYATAVGLVMHGLGRDDTIALSIEDDASVPGDGSTPRGDGSRSSILSRMRKFFDEF
ncbi:MAG TPA: cell division protein FtsA [Candidatus Kapabacteria bacterium]|jgi:cell division protein FtsA|nr:cell division protein FtsA [Candidatus Kapabacteria bacterium]